METIGLRRETKVLKIKYEDVFPIYKLMDMKDGDILENHIFRVEKKSRFLVFRKGFVSDSWWSILGVSDTPAKAYLLMDAFYDGVACCTKGYVIGEDNLGGNDEKD